MEAEWIWLQGRPGPHCDVLVDRGSGLCQEGPGFVVDPRTWPEAPNTQDHGGNMNSFVSLWNVIHEWETLRRGTDEEPLKSDLHINPIITKGENKYELWQKLSSKKPQIRDDFCVPEYPAIGTLCKAVKPVK